MNKKNDTQQSRAGQQGCWQVMDHLTFDPWSNKKIINRKAETLLLLYISSIILLLFSVLGNSPGKKTEKWDREADSMVVDGKHNHWGRFFRETAIKLEWNQLFAEEREIRRKEKIYFGICKYLKRNLYWIQSGFRYEPERGRREAFLDVTGEQIPWSDGSHYMFQ